jgi:hypothetical protein
MKVDAIQELIDTISDDPYGHPGWDAINAAEDELAALVGRPSRAHTDNFCECGKCTARKRGWTTYAEYLAWAAKQEADMRRPEPKEQP